MTNSKSLDFALLKMMQDFKNDLLHHFLVKFDLVYFDFGIINHSEILLGHQRPLTFDNACECLPITFLQNQKLNLFLFLGKYFSFKVIKNGVITKSHYVNRDVFLNKVNAGSYEYLEFVMKYQFFNENADNIVNLVSFILDDLRMLLNSFQSNHSKYLFRVYESNPHYLINNLKNIKSNKLEITKYSQKYESVFYEQYDWLTDDKNQSILVSFYDDKKPGHVDLMYVTVLDDRVERNKKYDELSLDKEVYEDIVDDLNRISDKYHNSIYIKLNMTNLIYYFFNCDNINMVEPCYLNKKLATKYNKKNIDYKENY